MRETLAIHKDTKRFIEDNKITVPRFYILTPIPELNFEDMMKAGRIIKEDIYSFDGTEAVHMPKNMSPDELTNAYWELYDSLFTFSSILKRNIIRKEFLINPSKYLFYTIVNLFYRYQIKNRITPNIF